MLSPRLFARRRTQLIQRQVPVAKRNGHREPRASPELALHSDRPSVQLHQLLYQREAYPCSFVRPAERSLDAMESLEDSCYLCPGDPGAGVGDDKLGCNAVTLQLHSNLAFRSQLHRV